MARRTWDQRPNETTKAYDAFAIYRDLGAGRSVLAAFKLYSGEDKRIPGYFGQWAADNQWVIRARDYDAFIDEQAQRKAERDAITRKAQMLNRHAGIGRVLQTKALEHLQKANSIDKAVDAIAAARLGVDMERKAEGLPEWILEVVNADEVELTRQYNELLAEIGGYRGGDEAAGDHSTGQDTSDEAD
jgi:hypothetical protein